MSATSRVLFVGAKNAGKSQMAAGLMKQVAEDAAEVSSAGTKPGTALNELSIASLQEVGVDITDGHPKAVTDEMIRAADLVVILGRRPTSRRSQAPGSNGGARTSPPSRASTASSGCVSSVTTSPSACGR